jgi:hypothetical protein
MALLGFVAHVTAQDWKKIKGNNYQINFQEAAGADIPEYQQQIESGIKSVNGFFGVYPKPFDVYIHPTRRSLDSTWQKDWSMPDFRSECWMVASGIATKLDMIAPKQWDQLACEHRYADKEKTQLLITHELVHVYHGQHNVSPDFSDVDGIDWLVEGLATYASGQCDDVRIAGVKKAVAEHRAPTRLDDFWKGDQKYGLSGSVVMYIDTQFGRAKLKLLLPLNNKSDVLSALGITEEHLLEEWKKYVGSLH